MVIFIKFNNNNVICHACVSIWIHYLKFKLTATSVVLNSHMITTEIWIMSAIFHVRISINSKSVISFFVAKNTWQDIKEYTDKITQWLDYPWRRNVRLNFKRKYLFKLNMNKNEWIFYIVNFKYVSNLYYSF